MLKKILLLSTIILLTGCWETIKGKKTGTIVKCANEGLIIKTYECEIIRGGMNNGNGSFGKSFHFTIEKPELKNIANDALDNQKEVVLDYHDEWTTFLRQEHYSEGFADNIIIK